MSEELPLPETRDSKTVSCAKCHKSFAHSSLLSKHKCRRMLDRPFECDICFRTFALKRNMLTHQVMHMRESPYTCIECKIKITEFKDFYLHHTSCHKDKTLLKCEQCQMFFYFQHQLLTHLKNHQVQKPLRRLRCRKKINTQVISREQNTATTEQPKSSQMQLEAPTVVALLTKKRQIIEVITLDDDEQGQGIVTTENQSNMAYQSDKDKLCQPSTSYQYQQSFPRTESLVEQEKPYATNENFGEHSFQTVVHAAEVPIFDPSPVIQAEILQEKYTTTEKELSQSDVILKLGPSNPSSATQHDYRNIFPQPSASYQCQQSFSDSKSPKKQKISHTVLENVNQLRPPAIILPGEDHSKKRNIFYNPSHPVETLKEKNTASRREWSDSAISFESARQNLTSLIQYVDRNIFNQPSTSHQYQQIFPDPKSPKKQNVSHKFLESISQLSPPVITLSDEDNSKVRTLFDSLPIKTLDEENTAGRRELSDGGISFESRPQNPTSTTRYEYRNILFQSTAPYQCQQSFFGSKSPIEQKLYDTVSEKISQLSPPINLSDEDYSNTKILFDNPTHFLPIETLQEENAATRELSDSDISFELKTQNPIRAAQHEDISTLIQPSTSHQIYQSSPHSKPITERKTSPTVMKNIINQLSPLVITATDEGDSEGEMLFYHPSDFPQAGILQTEDNIPRKLHKCDACPFSSHDLEEFERHLLSHFDDDK